ncbi:MAG: hypothetical protein ABDI19_02390, partial [Armatimonadota bacterium]
KSAPAQNAPKNAPPKEGSLRVKGESIRFFSRGEGTLTIKGHGFVLVGDLQGEIIPQGFRELKKLPRGVTLDPPMDKRIRIFHGKGTITIKGKYDSMKVALHTAEIEFRGGASFDIQGVGKGVRDGREEVVLYPSAVFTLIVPKPEGQAQPQAEEPKSVPEVRPLQPKAPQQQPNKKEAAK